MSINIQSTWLYIGLVVSTLGLLQGCTQKFNDVSATFQEAYNNYIDVELSPQEIKDIPYASAYLTLGDQKQVFVVLAFAEKNPLTDATQLKWVSADKSMIVTENGRIVKTIGLLKNNLVGLSGKIPDFDAAHTIQQSFSLTYDWMPDYRYGFSAKATRTFVQKESVVTPLYTSETDLISESVFFPSLSSTINNLYWVDNKGKVKRTIQHIGPNMVPIEFTILKGYAG